MALITEDGTIVEGAEAFADVATADTILAGLGFTSWAERSTDQKEIDLRKGAQFMEERWRSSWKGRRVSATQLLSFPRENVVVEGFAFPSDAVPAEVKRANVMLAMKSSLGVELNPDFTAGVKREKVDVLEVEYDTARVTAGTYFTAVEGLLKPFMGGSSSSSGFTTVKLVRT